MPDQTIKCPKCDTEIKLAVISIDKTQDTDAVITQKLENYRYFHQFLMNVSTKCLAVSGVMFAGFGWCYKNIQEKHWASWYSGVALVITISFIFLLNRGIVLVQNSAEDAGRIQAFDRVMPQNLKGHGWPGYIMVILLCIPWIAIFIKSWRLNDPFYQEKSSLLEIIGNLFMIRNINRGMTNYARPNN